MSTTGKAYLSMAIAVFILWIATIVAFGQGHPLQSLTKPVPLSDQWGKDRAAFIKACRGNNGIPVPVAGVVGSDGIDCAAKLGE